MSDRMIGYRSHYLRELMARDSDPARAASLQCNRESIAA